jgi:hypothetical protein
MVSSPPSLLRAYVPRSALAALLVLLAACCVANTNSKTSATLAVFWIGTGCIWGGGAWFGVGLYLMCRWVPGLASLMAYFVAHELIEAIKPSLLDNDLWGKDLSKPPKGACAA